jgi:aspartyl-tRNA(Asn)/glutamyl-tRNA(Gln) amidotransferase subunit C
MAYEAFKKTSRTLHVLLRLQVHSPPMLFAGNERQMKISREDVLRVAELAHLELSPEEIETYRGQLDEILTYVGKLERIDVTNVEPMAQVLFEAAGNAHPELREDKPQPCDVANAVLSRAADAAKPFFRVPKVIER